ncbi:ATPase [Vitreoscilla filiformis]|uniref:Virulence sensor protein BvgS n=1 Tax=Vitreoscilla filiformis TaxID=63 RepID=A0A221KAB0_VITFI|nr:ATP-binding protein [Vitreoscilla filiformis]ASM75946.1 ATPase [Vitreoscilla filiformis]
MTPPPGPEPPAAQRVVTIRRDYNAWVASETLEDYALRFTPHAFRKWSVWRVANTAFGASSFLVLEAVGATLLVQYGFLNAFWAILATGLVIFLAGWPISVYAARHGVDMDLLTRGAGFGYLGSTLTSLIYASFTFIFFALEAAIMAYALELAFDIPPAWGYLLCALGVLPVVTHGVTAISTLQVWTQPLWLVLLVLPYGYVLQHNPQVLHGLVQYGGEGGQTAGFQLQGFGAAMTVGIALITQMGEQVDYLRFMPERTVTNRRAWDAAVLVGGPGWVVPGVLKMLGGALLAYLAISHMVPAERAVDPNQMYLAAYEYMFGHYGWAVAATALLVIVSQLKINVTNAYAGSLAWSNFFSRVTHSHPGRVVWMVFNILIALMLMELDVFQALGGVLGLFSNIAISWIMAVVADLVINKPLGWSPPGIEFRRAYLPDINPVGVGAMGLASVLSVAAHLGAFGSMAQAFSALIALVTALLAAPAIAWATRGRYYLARPPEVLVPGRLYRCVVCERDYQAEDMARCPAYGGLICSLCCTLDARCADRCKPQPRLVDWVWQRWSAVLERWLPRRLATRVDTGLGHYLLLMSAIVPLLGALFVLLYRQEVKQLGERGALLPAQTLALLEPVLRAGFLKAYAALLLVASVVAWWLVLAHRSRQVAHEEISRQTEALMREIDSHRQTDLQLQEAKRQAEAANQAKTRYISAISHELRTPLNSILGYAQLLEEDASMPANRRQAVSVIRRGGDHLLSLIEGTLDIARIESGKLSLEVRPMAFRHLMDEIAGMFELQAQAKGIRFERDFGHDVPEAVRADERRLRQILINLLGNAVKFTHHGGVVFRLRYAREMARLDIVDSGPGMSEAELERVFDPFVRGSAAGGAATGTGLGLTISKMLTELMGGELSARSTPGQGTTFSVRLFLPEVSLARTEPVGGRPGPTRVGYDGPRRTILVVDNEEADRAWLADSLQPLGFVIEQAASGEACLARLADLQPDAIFMDLAMPGIDGWETLRRLRAQGLSLAPVAIVSANAFDKGLDNDVGITPADFLVKPVRRADVLDWLGRRLHLQWQAGAPVPQPDAAPAHAAAGVGSNGPRVLPDAVALETLRRVVAMGYPRGILRQLDQIQAERPDTEPFIQRLRPLARAFQFEALDGLLRDALDELRSA